MKMRVTQGDSDTDVLSRRNAMQVMQALREKIESGEIHSGGYLPGVRDLSRAHGVAPNTVLRALHMLADQGLIEARPRRGYWIREADADGAAYVYLTSTQNIVNGFDALYNVLIQELNASTLSRGERLTTIVLNPGDVRHAIQQHAISRMSGLVLDTPNEALLEWIQKAGASAVLIDDEDAQRRVNNVVQSNFAGGELAAVHLLKAGCKRIAWFGKSLDHHHSRSRYGGALTQLGSAQREFCASHFSALDAQDLEQTAITLLKQRPDGVLALWRPMAAAIAAAARKLGLKIGADFQLVGWSCEELYDSSYVPLFDGPTPPAIVWSAKRMAAAAMDILRAKPTVAPGAALSTLIPVTLRVSQ